ncbi:MAG: PBP1A family penicillin-binding protein, partial [Massilia sp.]|nr:PBP1A family penicillin-binding protein [Massilia sp.]
MRWSSRRTVAFSALAIASIIALLVAGLLIYFFAVISPKVPPIDAVTDYKPKIPLRIYTADNVLIGEFGEEHRDFVAIKNVPDLMKKAVLAIEDTRFYEHGGIDWIRAAAAVRANLKGGFRQGGSTITMQVARNFFLSRDKKIGRKVNEVALAYKIEGALSKDQILELYFNQIFMGRRSYGFASAARAYFGKDLEQLSIAEMAMLAGIPQDPVRHNPAVNPRRAKQRQETVLRRMRDVGFITEAQFAAALAEPMRIASARQEFGTHAEYVAELVRQEVVAEFKDEAYTRGLSVITTIRKAEQDAAYDSVRRNVLAYDQRHGYRGPEAFIDLPTEPAEREEAINQALRARPSSEGLVPVVVTEAGPKLVKVENLDGDSIAISGANLKFAAPALAANAKPSLMLRPGAIVRIAREGDKPWAIVQVPLVAAAFVALDARTGAYHALVGGFDFNLQKYNHVTQAWRQPGSSMKPFIYSAALERGYSPATMILDEPLNMPGENAGATWSPQNDDGKFDGQVTMRFALAHSKNVPSVRLLRAVGTTYAHNFLGKFGFTAEKHPNNLTLALGTGAVTPLQMAGAYAIFSNGGYQVKPYLIAMVKDAAGTVIAQTKPAPTLDETARVLDARNAFVVDTMLRDVTRYGTGAAATQRLSRTDIAGKTGTTSDAVDGWFAGYGANVVAVAWMGYDDPKSLGGREFGATLAM